MTGVIRRKLQVRLIVTRSPIPTVSPSPFASVKVGAAGVERLSWQRRELPAQDQQPHGVRQLAPGPRPGGALGPGHPRRGARRAPRRRDRWLGRGEPAGLRPDRRRDRRDQHHRPQGVLRRRLPRVRQNGFAIVPGRYHFNGDEALAYARVRKAVGENDFTRAGRQQEIVVAARDRVVSGGFLNDPTGFLQAMGQLVTTGLSPKHNRQVRRGGVEGHQRPRLPPGDPARRSSTRRPGMRAARSRCRISSGSTSSALRRFRPPERCRSGSRRSRPMTAGPRRRSFRR
jgi:LytR_cpsA_psr family